MKQVPLPENLKSSQTPASANVPTVQDKPLEKQHVNKVEKQQGEKVEKATKKEDKSTKKQGEFKQYIALIFFFREMLYFDLLPPRKITLILE